MSPVLLLLLLAQAGPMAAAPVPDPILAEQRGGFRLPSGIDVALTVQTQSAINGAVVLRTVFQLDKGPASLTIYAPKPGETVAAGDRGTATQGTGMPSVSYDSRNGIQVQPAIGGPNVAISSRSASASAAVPAGLAQVASGAQTDAGLVTEAARGGVQTVELRGADLSITHLSGNAFGSAIANTGSDRTIDTTTSVSIDLANAGPDVLGSAMMRVQDVATDAATMRIN